MSIPTDILSVVADLNPWWADPAVRRALRWPVRRGVHRRMLEHLLRVGERRAQVLIGPRQVGKTTLLRQLADDLLERGWPGRNLTYFDLEDFRLARDLGPEQIAGLKPAEIDPGWPRVLLLDEVRRVPRWDRWLKQTVDEQGERLRIVVTDSAAGLLREAGRESGLGRWDEIAIEGLTFSEFALLNDTSERSGPRPPDLVERYLSLGGFPAYATADDAPRVRERLREDVVDRALRKDLADLVDDPEQLRRLFVFLVQSSGGESEPSRRAADLGVARGSVHRWFDLLEDTRLLVRLAPGSMSSKAAARLRGKPKLYAADHGLINAFADQPPRTDEVRGQVFEAAVFRHLRELAREGRREVAFLRWGDGLEVDFVLIDTAPAVAIEVTQSVRPKSEKLARLREAAGRAGAGRAVLIYGGLGEVEEGGVSLVPISRFLVDPAQATDSSGGR